MTYSSSPINTQPMPSTFQIIQREDGHVVAYCPTQSQAIRVVMALNFLEQQRFTQLQRVVLEPVSKDAEIKCASCNHRFPIAKIGTVRILSSGKEDAQPCCPMCGEVIALTATSTPTFAEWHSQYRK